MRSILHSDFEGTKWTRIEVEKEVAAVESTWNCKVKEMKS